MKLHFSGNMGSDLDDLIKWHHFYGFEIKWMRHAMTCAACCFSKILEFSFLQIATTLCIFMSCAQVSYAQRHEDEERYRIVAEITQSGQYLSVTQTQNEDSVVDEAVSNRRRIVSTLPSTRTELIRIRQVQDALELSKQQKERLPLFIKEITEAEQKWSKGYLKDQATKEELFAFVVEKETALASFLSEAQNKELDAISKTVLLHKFGPEALLTSIEFASVGLSKAQRERLTVSIREFEEKAKARLQEIYWMHTLETLELTLTSEQKATLKEIVHPQAIDWVILSKQVEVHNDHR